MPANIVTFPKTMAEPPSLDIDSMYRRLSESLSGVVRDLEQFNAEVDLVIAKGGMSREEMDGVFLSQLVATSNIRRIDRILRSLSAIRIKADGGTR